MRTKRCWLRPLEPLFFGFAALAEGDDFCGVDSIGVDLHFDDFAALVDQVVDAASRFVLGIVKAVLFGNVTAPITQQGKSDGDFFCPRGVAEGAVHANTQDLRSEEHTSELQSRFDLVCRLLLEKKNE